LEKCTDETILVASAHALQKQSLILLYISKNGTHEDEQTGTYFRVRSGWNGITQAFFPQHFFGRYFCRENDDVSLIFVERQCFRLQVTL
jgi:hypothetical protein